MTDQNKALRAFAEAQILAAQKLLATLAASEVEDDENEPPAAPAKPGVTKGVKPAKKAAAKVVEPEDDEDDDADEDPQAARKAELQAMKIMALKALAIKKGFKADGVRSATKVEIIDAILTDEFETTAEDEDDEEESETSDVNYTREDLQGMGIRKVKALAYEKGSTVADLKGLTLDEVIDVLLGEGDAEEDDEDDEDDEPKTYSRADFEAMSLAELKQIGREYERDYPGWKMPKNATKPVLIESFLEDTEEEDEE